MLNIKNLDAGYGFLQVVWNVSIRLKAEEIVCLIGPNGAGKTTILKTICGLVKPKRGNILFKGESIVGQKCEDVCWKGISYISEELNLFPNMSVDENLLMGAYTVRDKKQKEDKLEFAFDLFSKLKERKTQLAGTLSGGERKMLAIARGMMSSPSLLMVDEPSLGLAPLLVSGVFKSLETLNKNGVTILLVEQNARKALEIATTGYILEKGKIVLEGRTSDLANNDRIRKIYLAV